MANLAGGWERGADDKDYTMLYFESGFTVLLASLHSTSRLGSGLTNGNPHQNAAVTGVIRKNVCGEQQPIQGS
eukprot:365806-Chlamydomonas_euryale.AAC.19